MKIARKSINFNYKNKRKFIILNKLKTMAFNFATKKSMPLFTKGKDIISVAPLVSGEYEPHIKQLIEYLANNNYSDFLIDVGANIGLISCQSGGKFNEVHLFEPNPLIYKILDANCALSLNKNSYTLYNFGLGDRSAKAKLTIPKNNWGGAFINDDNNSYSDDILSKKDGNLQLLDDNYLNFDININKSTEVFRNLFSGLSDRGLKNGIIKIDVEGYEKIVIDAIAKQLPKDFNIYIVFESWDVNFDLKSIENAFQNRVNFFKMNNSSNFITSNNKVLRKLFKYLYLIFRGETYTLKELRGCNTRGDIVLQIEPLK